MSSFIIANKKLWSCGYNASSQLGHGDVENRTVFTEIKSDQNFIAVSCASDHAIAIDENGKLWSCGFNRYGQLGLADTENRKKFTEVKLDQRFISVSTGYLHSVALDETGKLWSCGLNAMWSIRSW